MSKSITASHEGYSASIQPKKGMAYVVIKIKDNGKSKNKWLSTGLKMTSTKKLLKEALISKLIQFVNKEKEKDAMELKKTMLFHNYLKYWINDKKKDCENNLMRLSTFEGYEVRVNKHFIPYFEKLNLPIKEIKPCHITQYLKLKSSSGRCDNKDGGLLERTVYDHRTLLHKIFNDALFLELIEWNPTDNIKCKKFDRYSIKNRNIITNSEGIIKFLEVINNEYIGVKLAYTIALQYGLRRSEVVSLMWKAINFDKNTIKINHTVVATKTLDASFNTKTEASKRDITITNDTKNQLLLLKTEQDKNRELFKSDYKKEKDEYVFCHQDGSLIHPDYLTKHLSLLLRKNGMPHMRFHDLRHSAASILYNNKCDPKDIQCLLGHSDITTTMNLYTHTPKESMNRACNTIQSIYNI